MSEVRGQLHGPGFPVAGVPAMAGFHGDFLRVTVEGGAFEDVPVESLDVSVTGFNEDTLQLGWQHGGHTHAVTIADPAAHRILLRHAPAGFAPRLRGGHATLGWHRRKWNVVIGVLASLALLLVVAWWQSDAITLWLANRVSLETEIDIGERALAQFESEHELTRDGLGARTLAEIGGRLTQGSRYQYRWYVSNDSEINAFALPGGIVVVNAGMFAAMDSAEELAGVLAHEVQHVEQRHTLQRLIHAAGWAAVLAVVLGDVSAVTAVVVHQLGTLRNSRQLEAQADLEGMKALARAGIPLDGMASLFRKLSAEEGKSGGPGIALLHSHPATAERIAELEQLAATLKCECKPLAVDWPAVKAAVQEQQGVER